MSTKWEHPGEGCLSMAMYLPEKITLKNDIHCAIAATNELLGHVLTSNVDGIHVLTSNVDGIHVFQNSLSNYYYY